MNNLKTFLVKNWKTGVGGLAILILTGLQTQGKISAELYASLLGLLTALGFIASKDADKKGV